MSANAPTPKSTDRAQSGAGVFKIPLDREHAFAIALHLATGGDFALLDRFVAEMKEGKVVFDGAAALAPAHRAPAPGAAGPADAVASGYLADAIRRFLEPFGETTINVRSDSGVVSNARLLRMALERSDAALADPGAGRAAGVSSQGRQGGDRGEGRAGETWIPGGDWTPNAETIAAMEDARAGRMERVTLDQLRAEIEAPETAALTRDLAADLIVRLRKPGVLDMPITDPVDQTVLLEALADLAAKPPPDRGEGATLLVRGEATFVEGWFTDEHERRARLAARGTAPEGDAVTVSAAGAPPVTISDAPSRDLSGSAGQAAPAGGPDPRAVADKIAPVQGYSAGIPWSLHQRAWDAYAKRYGRQQSADRMAERGGFGCGELDMFVPGWRDEVSEIGRLKTALAASESRAADAEARVEAAERRADTTRADALEEAAKIAETRGRGDHEWVRDSLWDAIRKRTAADIRAAARALRREPQP